MGDETVETSDGRTSPPFSYSGSPSPRSPLSFRSKSQFQDFSPVEYRVSSERLPPGHDSHGLAAVILLPTLGPIPPSTAYSYTSQAEQSHNDAHIKASEGSQRHASENQV